MAQVVLVVHGMGDDAGSPRAPDRKAWVKDVEAALRAAASSYQGIDPAQLIVEPILYDDVFQKHALTWQRLAESLRGTPLAKLTSFMTNAAEGGFLWGSVGDVVQYRGLAVVRQNVHTQVATQIAAAVAKHGTTHSYSVLAHSLGSAVAHDAISALARREVRGNTVLHPPNFRFANFFALANVSRLIWATSDDFYATTCVRPFESGLAAEQCAVHHYITFRHVADPLASIVRFAPKNWARGRFETIELRHFRDLNVHAFAHYLRTPQVTDRILTRLFPAAITRPQRAQRFAAFPDYEGPLKDAKKRAVDGVQQLLDGIDGQAHGRLELDIDALARALWQSRERLSR